MSGMGKDRAGTHLKALYRCCYLCYMHKGKIVPADGYYLTMHDQKVDACEECLKGCEDHNAKDLDIVFRITRFDSDKDRWEEV